MDRLSINEFFQMISEEAALLERNGALESAGVMWEKASKCIMYVSNAKFTYARHRAEFCKHWASYYL